MMRSPTASSATEVAREAVIASGRRTGTVTVTVTEAATESAAIAIAAATGTAAAAAPQTPRGLHAVIPAVIGAVDAGVGAGTVKIGPHVAIETGTTIAAAVMVDRDLDHQAADSTALETATIAGIIENAGSDEMMTETAAAVGPLAQIKMSAATLLRRS
jgi:hypothetical protein